MFWDIQDGHHSIIFMQCSSIRYKADARTQAEKRAFSHYMIPRFTGFRVAENDIDYQTVCTKVCTDEMRNNMIVNDVLKAVRSGRTSWPTQRWRYSPQKKTIAKSARNARRKVVEKCREL